MEKIKKLTENLEQTVYGEKELLENAVVCLIANGHLLIEGPPGIGKTVMARSVAGSIGAEFRRIQFTSDLMPADVLGTSVFDREKGEFSFKKGPIFTHVFLADEINRANPKTQSSLLEAMDERGVSVDAGTFRLPTPFFVLATENPVEFEGTYSLPEAQVDRFLLRLRMTYPNPDAEKQLYEHGSTEPEVKSLPAVVTCDEMIALQKQAAGVRVEDSLLDYTHEVIARTRSHPDVELGVSPRGGLLWLRAARARALMGGRDYVVPDDLKKFSVPALAHRLSVIAAQDMEGISSAQDTIIRQIIETIEVPR